MDSSQSKKNEKYEGHSIFICNNCSFVVQELCKVHVQRELKHYTDKKIKE